MRQFPCVNCGATLQVRDYQVGSSLTCNNCNTRQVVPGMAEHVPDPPPSPTPPETDLAALAEERSATPAPPPLADPPAYPFVLAVGWVLIVTGFIVALLGLLAATFSDDLPGGGVMARVGLAMNYLFYGLLMVGFGQLLHCVCDIARNSWRQVSLAGASSSPAHNPP